MRRSGHASTGSTRKENSLSPAFSGLPPKPAREFPPSPFKLIGRWSKRCSQHTRPYWPKLGDFAPLAAKHLLKPSERFELSNLHQASYVRMKFISVCCHAHSITKRRNGMVK